MRFLHGSRIVMTLLVNRRINEEIFTTFTVSLSVEFRSYFMLQLNEDIFKEGNMKATRESTYWNQKE